MKKYIYEILTGTTGTTSYQLPIFLEASVDEMGIMVGFDGEIEQVEQFCNFTYKGGGTPTSPTPSPTPSLSSIAPSVTPSIPISPSSTPSNTVSMSISASLIPVVSSTPTPSTSPTMVTVSYTLSEGGGGHGRLRVLDKDLVEVLDVFTDDPNGSFQILSSLLPLKAIGSWQTGSGSITRFRICNTFSGYEGEIFTSDDITQLYDNFIDPMGSQSHTFNPTPPWEISIQCTNNQSLIACPV